MQLSPIAERISEAVLIFDAAAKVVDANTASAKLMAFSREKLIGRSLDELASRLREREGQRAARSLELATSRALRGHPVRDELRTYGPLPGLNDSPLKVLVSADPVWGDDGEIRGAMLVLSDFTEFALMQQRLADAGRQIATARIAACILHDFGNVLHAILQAVAMVEMPAPVRKNDTNYFKLIRTSAEHGAEMLHRWREFTRGGAGDRRSIEVTSLLEETLDLVRLLGQHRQVCIRTDLRPVALVYGNCVDLKRVFTNLALNAIEAMPHGGELRVSTAQQDRRVRVLISDTGKGISSDESERLFLPYFTTKATGTGLGLAGVKETLAAHGGEISFTSEVGRGSCFIVELPELSKEKRD